jgi:nucleotide-binding universal stress UspA family protein
MSSTKEQRVIIGIEDSVTGLQALRHGVAEARRRRATVYALRAWSGGTSMQLGVPPSWRVELAAASAQLARQAFVTALGGIPSEVEVRVVAVEEIAGRALVAFADRADDLLVVGDSQRAGLARLRSGRVARYCTRHAVCPVLVVPPPALARIGRISARELTREAQRLVNIPP